MLFTDEILVNLRVPHVHPSQIDKMNKDQEKLAEKSPNEKVDEAATI